MDIHKDSAQSLLSQISSKEAIRLDTDLLLKPTDKEAGPRPATNFTHDLGLDPLATGGVGPDLPVTTNHSPHMTSDTVYVKSPATHFKTSKTLSVINV